jgi:hypothetical protein
MINPWVATRKLELLDKFDIPLRKKLGGVGKQGYTMLYGKPQIDVG